MPRVAVPIDVAISVRYGRVLRPDELGVHGDGPWVVLDGEGEVLAVYRPHKETLVKPVDGAGSGAGRVIRGWRS